MVTRDMKRRVTGLTAVLVVIACWGCGGGAPSVSSSSEEAEVKGTVRIKGKPATGGQVLFDPSNINRKSAPIATAAIGKDGSYELKTLVGDNAVRVNAPEVARDPNLMGNIQPVNVKSGENTIPIDVH